MCKGVSFQILEFFIIQTIFLFVKPIFAFCTILVMLVSMVYPLALMYPKREGTSSAVKK